MKATTSGLRQDLGCGYEPPIENAHPWEPPGGKHGYQHGTPTMCAGYLTSLPDVLDAARAWTHWEKGQLATYCGEQPNDAMLMAVEILNGDIQQHQSWQMTPVDEGGGRK